MKAYLRQAIYRQCDVRTFLGFGAVRCAGIAVLYSCLLATAALADVTGYRSTVVNNETGGSALVNFVTNDIKIDFDDRYTSAAAIINLNSGSFYQDPFGGLLPPNQLLIDVFPSLRFDTFVAQGTPTLGGSFGDPSSWGGAVDLGGNPAATFTSDAINQAWGFSPGNVIVNQMSFLIGRFTLSSNASGTARFAVFTNIVGTSTVRSSKFELAIHNGVISVPEPATVSLLAAVGLCLVSFDARRCCR